MAREELEIEISPEGKVTIKTIGIKGPRCLEIGEALAEMIGREEHRQLTAEYYESEQHVEGRIDVHRRLG
jgi:hypothetical protein